MDLSVIQIKSMLEGAKEVAIMQSSNSNSGGDSGEVGEKKKDDLPEFISSLGHSVNISPRAQKAFSKMISKKQKPKV